MKKYLFLLIYFLSFSNFALAQNSEIPVEIKANFSNPKILGAANLRVYALNIYDVSLWSENSANSENYQDKFAIRIKYNRNFTKEQLVTKSIEEITRMHQVSEIKAKEYNDKLNNLMIGVKKGETRTAFFNKDTGLQLYRNGVLSGKSDDKIFAKYFTDIWLNENAEFKSVRNQLIGLNDKK